MKRILLTGMSGVGKSSVIQALADRGYKAVDADEGFSELTPDGEWVWLEDRIQSLLSTEGAETLFLSGCTRNQGKFYGQFDHIILLSAPVDLMRDRLRTRTNNPFGKDPAELAKVLCDLEAVEPLLRRGAHHEIVTTLPLDEVVDRILLIARSAE